MIGVNVAVIEDGRILLTQREDFNVWCLPGGHMDDGESFAQAARREMREETGLEVALTRLVGLYARPAWAGGHQIALFAGRIVGGELRLDPHEVVAAGYFAADDLPADLLLGHRQRILDALSGESGLVRSEMFQYPFERPLLRPELYALRDASGLSRAEFYRQRFAALENGPGRLEVGPVDVRDES